jgi:phage tail-like protein
MARSIAPRDQKSMNDEAPITRRNMLDYLPAIYKESDSPDPKPFLGSSLAAFERVLLGYEEGKTAAKGKGVSHAIEGLGRKIARLFMVFDPYETPEKFLSWLASWAALSLHANLSEAKQRALIANIIPLYQIRGTRRYVERLLALCVDAGTSVSEEEIPPMQLGVHSTVGRDTYLGGSPPHFFRVKMVASEMTALQVQAQRQIAYEVIELAKPAHTVYDFVVDSPEMQVGIHSTVGVDTVLGAAAAQLP